MTEAEWLACNVSLPMLEFLRGRPSERKLRLFAAACFRNLEFLLPDRRQRRAVEMLESMAERTASTDARRGATRDARQAMPPSPAIVVDSARDDPHFVALMLYRELASSRAGIHAATATAGLAEGAAEQEWQCCILRDILGPFAFRAIATDPRWITTVAVGLAEAIYADRAFDRLPILADALEDAGCDNADILTHCRGDGPHVRGCWVVDLVLGKS